MKIAHFNTYDGGGAGIAARRLNKGLNMIGEQSRLFVKYKNSIDENVNQIISSDVHNRFFDKLSSKYFLNNIKEGSTITSIMYPSIGFEFLNAIEEFEIINLHWISTFISIEAIMKIYAMGKPIVWTLHDQNPMTGACHYTNGCDKFKKDCSFCPQLVEDRFNIARKILECKTNNFPKDITIVTPSKWLAECARESAVFKNNRIEVIKNSLETYLYKPYDKIEAKRSLGVSDSTKVILFGANDLTEKRKGFINLLEAAKILKGIKYIENLIDRNELCILTFGQGSHLLDTMNLPYKSLGYVNDDQNLSTIYSAADVLVLPSTEDNLPNVMLESMSCGTPVVSFEIGGMKDVIKNEYNGYTCGINNVQALAENIVKCLSKDGSISNNCREYAIKNFKLENQANNYRELYKELIINHNNKSSSAQVNIPYILPEASSFINQCICELSVDINNELNELEKRCIELNNETEAQKQNNELMKNALNRDINSITLERNKLKLEQDLLVSERDALRQEKDLIESENDVLRQEKDLIESENDALKQEKDLIESERDALKTQICSLQNSKSWTITKPFRVSKRLIKKTIKFLLPYAVIRYYQLKKYGK
ncbi:glycosyltransferase [Clostridium magnum]|uniref:D-inositol 3-phosphate glycosyltransferase n=1 Tax=Clostridium magnum DSM 2767 TaxID=1121326 RepID=A0A162RP86_9CLOT|nr:glycosyltransferase [Clostridium magnum]KZL90193.1 D-inositol 3-phosphate glycosyltransferase [Clostridium magnum DSM 2767]SHH64015.1 Glycosyltransferase involved in cell wall bisynthesis [Clostridium magnum DSM 2767]